MRLTYAELPADERCPHRDALVAHHLQLAIWAQHCPENFEHQRALVAAEIARVEGRDLDAMNLYEHAIRSAHENGFVHHEALADELAGRFYLDRGLDKNGVTHLRDAHDCYARWGADGKVKQLDRKYPDFVESRLPAPATTVAMRTEQLDLFSVTKASQSISGEIILDKLLRTLLTIVLEQGGAERACLVLCQGEVLSIEAEAILDASGVVKTILEATPMEDSQRIPASVVHYAQRTKERVILNDNAENGAEFAGDSYFAAHRPKSVLCLPIRWQAEVVGLLYLENDLLAGAFTPDSARRPGAPRNASRDLFAERAAARQREGGLRTGRVPRRSRGGALRVAGLRKDVCAHRPPLRARPLGLVRYRYRGGPRDPAPRRGTPRSHERAHAPGGADAISPSPGFPTPRHRGPSHGRACPHA